MVCAAGLHAQPAPPTAQRQQELVRMVRQDCGSCHGLRLTGGLGPALTREALADKPIGSPGSHHLRRSPRHPHGALESHGERSRGPVDCPATDGRFPRAAKGFPMKRRDCLALMGASSLLLAGCAGVPSATGHGRSRRCRGPLHGHAGDRQHQPAHTYWPRSRAWATSHASVVFSRDGRYAFVFGRDGAL